MLPFWHGLNYPRDPWDIILGIKQPYFLFNTIGPKSMVYMKEGKTESIKCPHRKTQQLSVVSPAVSYHAFTSMSTFFLLVVEQFKQKAYVQKLGHCMSVAELYTMLKQGEDSNSNPALPTH